MNTGLVNDALQLCGNIYNALSPKDEWAIVNIGKSSNATFTYPSIPAIPSSFGYNFDRVPEFLKSEGVIEAMVDGRWFLGIVNDNSDSITRDIITLIARNKNYFTKTQSANYYHDFTFKRVSYGPKCPGQFAILINKEALTNFYTAYNYQENNYIPQFDFQTGKLSFLGEIIEVKGEIEIASMALLVQNINSKVTKQEFYELRKNVNYNQDVEKIGATKINDIVEKVFKSLKAKVRSNPKLKDALFFGQDDGFGLFVNQKIFQQATPPQKEAENSPDLG